MKTLSFVISLVITFVMQLATVFAQDSVKERIDVATQFVNDLRQGTSNTEVFKKYLRSAGSFRNENISQTANEWTDLMRNSIKSTIPGEVDVYKYSSRPEKARKVKSIEDPDNELVEDIPLEFELHSESNSIVAVEVDDLYVIKVRDERIFVLFDRTNKLITYFGLRWGQKVELTEM